MFSAYKPPRKKVVLDFGATPKETFSGFVKTDEIPKYDALDATDTPLKLTPANKVEDNSNLIFEAFGLSD